MQFVYCIYIYIYKSICELLYYFVTSIYQYNIFIISFDRLQFYLWAIFLTQCNEQIFSNSSAIRNQYDSYKNAVMMKVNMNIEQKPMISSSGGF